MKYVPLYLAVVLLLCLAPMPYGYFQLVRFMATIVFGVMAYRYYNERKEWLAYTCGTLVLLFQPFYKIALGRTVWNIVDVIVAIGLLILFFYEWRKGDGKKEIKNTTPPINIIGEPMESNSYEFKLQGKLWPKELIYVASEEDKELEDMLLNKPEVFEGWGQMMGFHIIYLPLLMKRLQEKRVLQYRAPYLSDTEVKSAIIGNDFLLHYLDNSADKAKIKHGFIRTENIHRGDDGEDKATNRFYPLSSKSGEPIVDQLHRISKQIAAEDSHKKLTGRSFDDWGEETPSESPADSHFNSQSDGENIEDLMEEVRERIIKLRQRGISEYLLEQLIHPDNRLSRMVITKDYRIILPDYHDMEIKMEPLVKAVYLLFLEHPEGILFKNLPDHRKELARIYSELRPTGLTDKALQSIEDVTNPLLNSINEKCARIRGAFVGQFDNYMARSYYIDGLRGEAKKIALPRDLVIFL